MILLFYSYCLPVETQHNRYTVCNLICGRRYINGKYVIFKNYYWDNHYDIDFSFRINTTLYYNMHHWYDLYNVFCFAYTGTIIKKIDLLHRSWPLSVGLVLVAQTWICIEVKTVRFLPFCKKIIIIIM